MRIVLEVQSGPNAGRTIDLSSGQIVQIGRSLDCALAFPDDFFMSGIHCVVQCSGKTCSIIDKGSTNGVSVNGDKVPSRALQNGDEIVAGRTHFRVSITDEAVSLDAPVGPRPAFAGMTEVQEGCDLVGLLRREFQPLHAILDAACDPKILQILQHSKEEYQSLYEGVRGQELAHVAPYLVRLPAECALLETLEKEGRAKNWGVYLTCELAFSDLRKHLRGFLTVNFPDGNKMLFRYYDPRVLRGFLPTTLEPEAVEFFGPVKCFMMQDELPEMFVQFKIESGQIAKKQFKLVAADPPAVAVGR